MKSKLLVSMNRTPSHPQAIICTDYSHFLFYFFLRCEHIKNPKPFLRWLYLFSSDSNSPDACVELSSFSTAKHINDQKRKILIHYHVRLLHEMDPPRSHHIFVTALSTNTAMILKQIRHDFLSIVWRWQNNLSSLSACNSCCSLSVHYALQHV